MGKPLRCRLGFHKWGRAAVSDHVSSSNVQDWKQGCLLCNKKIAWSQPKGSDKIVYPKHSAKRNEVWVLAVIAFILSLVIWKVLTN
ncbi:MAG: hypothetical protein JW727_01680 [Candidatus Aenigmarchaeota archaeon]|nr:hypothetical protein [Candidatus Aenigmarchaeota archaeon]